MSSSTEEYAHVVATSSATSTQISQKMDKYQDITEIVRTTENREYVKK
jgi:hypothetical protein